MRILQARISGQRYAGFLHRILGSCRRALEALTDTDTTACREAHSWRGLAWRRGCARACRQSAQCRSAAELAGRAAPRPAAPHAEASLSCLRPKARAAGIRSMPARACRRFASARCCRALQADGRRTVTDRCEACEPGPDSKSGRLCGATRGRPPGHAAGCDGRCLFRLPAGARGIARAWPRPWSEHARNQTRLERRMARRAGTLSSAAASRWGNGLSGYKRTGACSEAARVTELVRGLHCSALARAIVARARANGRQQKASAPSQPDCGGRPRGEQGPTTTPPPSP